VTRPFLKHSEFPGKPPLKILTDLGHPKNVHIVKHLVPRLQALGHECHCVWRERESMPELCRAYGLNGHSRGPGGTGILGKLFYLFKTDFQLLKLARKIKPDLLLSFASPYLANLALFTGIPMVVLDDTEENWLVQKIYSFCSEAIIVPECFGKELSKKQFRFKGYYELAYLAPRYFRPDPSILKELGLAAGEKIVLLRFVSWRAVHDMSHHGLTAEEKEELAASFSGMARVFISAEEELPDGLETLRLKTPPESIHQVMAHAALVFSEGATMAAEAAVLGVPTVHCSDLQPGYIADLDKRHGLLRSFVHKDFRAARALAMEFLESGEGLRQSLAGKRDEMLAESVDVVEFMVEFIDRFLKKVDSGW
jgi:uncharacterized protein